MKDRNCLRIGCGAGQAYDRFGPAKDLARDGNLDFLIFECLAERTLAHGHAERMRDPAKGYNSMLEKRLAAVLRPAHDNKTRIVTNMGSANPRAAGEAAAEVARSVGLAGLRIAVVEGDDVTSLVHSDTLLPEIGKTVKEFGSRMIGANAYLGADAIVPALDQGADVVITGRVADPSLFLAAIAHGYGWNLEDWQLAAHGTMIGHLLECTTQVTGGYFADPGVKDVADLVNLGYPIAEVKKNGEAIVTKLNGTGGLVTPLTVKEQLIYEVHDPRSYLTPDVTVDFTRVKVEAVGSNRVQVSNAIGRPRPSKLKALVAFDGGLRAEAEISYSGPNAQDRAKLALHVVRERMKSQKCNETIRFDLIGMNSIHATATNRASDTQDVRLRAAMRTADRDTAELLLSEVDGLHMGGPAGGGGYRSSIVPCVLTQPMFLDRDLVPTRVTMVIA